MKVSLYFTQVLLMKILWGFSILLLELDDSTNRITQVNPLDHV